MTSSSYYSDMVAAAGGILDHSGGYPVLFGFDAASWACFGHQVATAATLSSTTSRRML